MSKYHQTGAAQAVAIVVLVVALLGALGWIFYQNMTKETAKVENTDSSAVDTTKTVDTTDKVAALSYADLRKDKKDQTGTVLKTAEDVNGLTQASEKLIAYFKANVGEEADSMSGPVKRTFTVDRVYGDYAAGADNTAAAYQLWGPTDGSGDIKVVAGTQNTGFVCDDLKAAKVPSELVDVKCLVNGSGLTTYTTP